MLRGRDEVKKWPLKGNFMAIWDKICCMLAELGGCTLNRGSFACKLVRGDMQLAAKGRGTLNRGGRNCRWDCISKIIIARSFKLGQLIEDDE